MNINPLHYSLSSKVQLKEVGINEIGIVKIIKSRIIQKDAFKIIDIAKQIKNVNQDLNVKLICTSNICSKSKKILFENEIDIVLTDSI